jgi:putative glycosyltransferase (TIGR04372 family)
MGYCVVLLGNSDTHEIPNLPELVNAKAQGWKPELQVFAMLSSLFHIGTQSGPTSLALSLNLPVLQTNTTAIGRNMIKSNPLTTYLPKTILQRGKLLNISSIFMKNLAYCENNWLLKKNQVVFVENSPEDILNSVVIMERRVNQPTCEVKRLEEHEITVNQIRDSFNAVGYGDICPIFLENHQSFVS